MNETPTSDSETRPEDIQGEDVNIDEATGSAESVEQNADSLEARLAKAEAEAAEYKDQLLRSLAETDNIRKRAERQVSDERLYAIERFARDLLAVSDNMARALGAVTEDQLAEMTEAGRNILSGVELTQKELHAVLSRHGVTAIDATPGSQFDPNDHQAVSQIPSAQPTGTVAEMFQSGWKIGNRTLRAAMVAVSAGAPKSE